MLLKQPRLAIVLFIVAAELACVAMWWNEDGQKLKSLALANMVVLAGMSIYRLVARR